MAAAARSCHPEPMRCELTGRVEEYAARVAGLLERDPVVNNVLLTVVEGTRAGRYDDALFAWVEDGGEVVDAASHTPPFRLLLSAMPAVAVDAVCDRLLAVDHRVSGVSGPAGQSRRFADRWSAGTGTQARVRMAQRLLRLGRLSPPAGVPGQLRPAGAPDLRVVAEWIRGFSTGAGVEPAVDPDLDAERRVSDHSLYLWDVGSRPVSMAGNSYPVAGAARISLVYTPPKLRGRGYAGACVAEVSRRLLDAGNRECLLYTDLANPTANSVYSRIGYRPVLDAQELDFG